MRKISNFFELAEKLRAKGFDTKDIGSSDFNQDLVDLIEMQLVDIFQELDGIGEPTNRAEWAEYIGEV
jgi:hypothetical protein